MRHHPIGKCWRWVPAGLFGVIALAGCGEEVALPYQEAVSGPYQEYKAYQALFLQELRLIDSAGEEINRPEFAQDYGRLPEFSKIEDTRQRKQAFLDYLRPVVRYQNDLNRERRLLLGAVAIKLNGDLTLEYPEQLFMLTMRKRYRIDEEISDREALPILQRRLDTLPSSLVLAQAAIESGWGTSRFAREANNLFGQWCFTEGCGLVPGQRNTNAKHEVARFASVDQAVASYYRNINTHPVYRPVRDIRQQSRLEEQPVSGLDMAAGLIRYSERGAEYVEKVRSVIRVNKLESPLPRPIEAPEVNISSE